MSESRDVMLDVDIVVQRGGFTLDVEFQVRVGSTVAVIGPNGSGKSTLVSALAGFERSAFGRLTMDGLIVDDPSNGVWVPAEERPLALAPQDGLLFPHLSAIANVGFGLKHRSGEPRAAKAAIEAVGLGSRRRAKPGKLSGGEAQRVALARAVVLKQPILVLDEPLSRVDAERRRELRDWVRAERPPEQVQVVVTHGADHAAEADSVIVLDNGRVVASGPPHELNANPPNPWVKAFFA